jgi:sporulation protein YlmC with PRC-barrel domain
MGGLLLTLTGGAIAIAAEPARSNSVSPTGNAAGANDINAENSANAASAINELRASSITKMTVKNDKGEKLGSIDDLVIDVTTGRVAYAALGFGGVLGIGEKLFAVPWNQLHLQRDQDERFLVLHVSSEALKKAPGFDKSHWPDFADPNFTGRIDNFYRDNAH